MCIIIPIRFRLLCCQVTIEGDYAVMLYVMTAGVQLPGLVFCRAELCKHLPLLVFLRPYAQWLGSVEIFGGRQYENAALAAFQLSCYLEPAGMRHVAVLT